MTTYEGHRGSISIEGDTVVIEKKTLGVGPGPVISLRDVTGCVLHPVTIGGTGWLQVLTADRRDVMSSGMKAANHPNCVFYRPGKQQDSFAALFQWLQHVADINATRGASEIHQAPTVTPPTPTASGPAATSLTHSNNSHTSDKNDKNVARSVEPQDAVPQAVPTVERGFWEERRYRKAAAAYEEQLEAWNDINDVLQQALATQEIPDGAPGSQADGFVLRANETVFLQVTGAVLIEPRVAPGTYTGGSHGVSFRIAKGVSYRVGQNRGTYQPGPTNPTPIDTGDALISSDRVLFRGTKATREWAFAKLVGYTHSDTNDWTALQVSNRQRTSGIGYGQAAAPLFQYRLEWALAHWRRADIQPLIDEITEQQLQHRQQKPQPPG